MDWDKQFASIVTETEANLAKVKQRLESARAVTASLTTVGGPPQRAGATVGSVQPSAAAPFSRPEGADVHAARDDLGRLPLTPRPSLADASRLAMASGSTPGWVLLLEDKVSRQNKMIEELVQTVHELQAEKKEYWSQMKDIREAVASLHERVIERGVDLQTEAKMEQWRRMTEDELASLRRHVQQQQQSALGASKEQESGSVAAAAVAASKQIQELRLQMRENKNLLRDEYDHVMKEVERMKAKLITIEHTIAAVNEETVAFTKRQGTLHDNLSELADSARSNYKELAALLKEKTHEISAQKEEIRDLRHQVHGLPSGSGQAARPASDRQRPDDSRPPFTAAGTPLRRKQESVGLSPLHASGSSSDCGSSSSSSDGNAAGRRAHLAVGWPAAAAGVRPPRQTLSRSERSASDSDLAMGYVAPRKVRPAAHDESDLDTMVSRSSLSSLSLSDLE